MANTTDKELTSGEELIDTLDTLREALCALSDRLSESGIERTNGLRKIMGNDCEYYRRSLDLLLTKDYLDLKDLTESAHNLFLLIEGKMK